jgi:hypothetical protein
MKQKVLYGQAWSNKNPRAILCARRCLLPLGCLCVLASLVNVDSVAQSVPVTRMRSPIALQRVAVAADGSFLIKGLPSDSYQIVPELRGG